jgi:hypothetical protein
VVIGIDGSEELERDAKRRGKPAKRLQRLVDLLIVDEIA